MRRLQPLSLAVGLCLVFCVSTSVLADDVSPAASANAETTEVSWLETLGDCLDVLVAAVFGSDCGDNLIPDGEPESNDPVLNDGSGLDEGWPVASITRDDGWEYQR